MNASRVDDSHLLIPPQSCILQVLAVVCLCDFVTHAYRSQKVYEVLKITHDQTRDMHLSKKVFSNGVLKESNHRNFQTKLVVGLDKVGLVLLGLPTYQLN